MFAKVIHSGNSVIHSLVDVQFPVLTETMIHFLNCIISPSALNVLFFELCNFKYKSMLFSHCRLCHSFSLFPQHLSLFLLFLLHCRIHVKISYRHIICIEIKNLFNLKYVQKNYYFLLSLTCIYFYLNGMSKIFYAIFFYQERKKVHPHDLSTRHRSKD